MCTLLKMRMAFICAGFAVCVAQAAEVNLPGDTSAHLVVRELQISGNTLISTETCASSRHTESHSAQRNLIRKLLFSLRG